MTIPSPNSLSWDPHQPSPRVLLPHAVSVKPVLIFGSTKRSWEIEQSHMRLLSDFRTSPSLPMKASTNSPGSTQELRNDKAGQIIETEKRADLFDDMKHRFLSFKEEKYNANLEHYEQLANAQAPKFLVIACADSRVCPSAILGFQPGEAFMVRNIANLVPPFENGPTETNAALEFAVNTLKKQRLSRLRRLDMLCKKKSLIAGLAKRLYSRSIVIEKKFGFQVENVLVIGHSCCGGIRALMGMDEEATSKGFIQNWVIHGKNAKLKTKAAASNLGFDQQCKHCEKESVNRSLINLLTYPWIEEKVSEGVLLIHGGYYDFVDCTFEKWTLDYKECSLKEEEDERISVKDRSFWC